MTEYPPTFRAIVTIAVKEEVITAAEAFELGAAHGADHLAAANSIRRLCSDRDTARRPLISIARAIAAYERATGQWTELPEPS